MLCDELSCSSASWPLQPLNLKNFLSLQNCTLFSRVGAWHLGHRTPVRLFDCSKEDQLLACFHYTNLQPEWAKDHQQRVNEKRSRQKTFLTTRTTDSKFTM